MRHMKITDINHMDDDLQLMSNFNESMNSLINDIEISYTERVINKLTDYNDIRACNSDSVMNDIRVGYNDSVMNDIRAGYNDSVMNDIRAGYNDIYTIYFRR